MLYERKIFGNGHAEITDVKADDLPSFFRINKARNYSEWIVNVDSSGKSQSGDDGTFGDNKYSCVIDFCGDPNELKSGSKAGKRICAFWNFLSNSANGLAFPSSYLKDFVIAKIFDYGYQSMSLSNYDIEVKVFDTKGNKYPSFNTALIRLYSGKEIYVIVDTAGNQPTVGDVTAKSSIGMIIVDFRYRSMAIPKESIDVNSAHNAQEYDNDPYNASPYLDMKYFKSGISFLNWQADYFKRIMQTEYKSASINITTSGSYSNVALSSYARENAAPYSKMYQEYPEITYESSSVKCDSLSEEIYAYTQEDANTGKYLGVRVLPGKSKGAEFVETYVTLPRYIRYLMSSSGSVPNDVLSDARGFLKKNNLYLWNSDFKNIIFITDSGNSYPSSQTGTAETAEIVLPIQYSGHNASAADPSADVDQTCFSKYSISGKLTDCKSEYDITALDCDSYYSSADGTLVVHPYLENDDFIKSVLTDGEPVVEFETMENEKESLEEYRKKMVMASSEFDDSNFDVYLSSASAFSVTNTLKSSDIIPSFSKDLSSRKGGDKAANTDSSAIENAIAMKAKDSTISENLAKLIPSGVKFSSSGTQVDLSSCFAVAIAGSQNENELVATECFANTNTKTKKTFYKIADKEIFIIPSDGADSIEFDNPKSYYFIK